MKPRRTKGSGWLFKRGDTYWFQISVDGKKVRQSTGTANKIAAQKKLNDALARAGKGEPVTTGKIALSTILDLVIQDYRINKRPSIQHIEISARHVGDYFGPCLTSAISPDSISSFIEDMQQRDYKASTINRCLAILIRGFNLAIQSQKLVFAPKIKLLKECNTRKNWVSLEQFESIITYLPEHLLPIVKIGFHHGFRIGEILNLQWPQIDLVSGLIILNPGETKSGEGRVVSMHPEILEHLKAMSEKQHGSYLFSRRKTGKPLHNIEKTWKKACVKAGCEGAWVHDLRRSAIRNLVRAGVPDSVAMRISGHKTRKVFDRYNIVSESDVIAATPKLMAYYESLKTDRTQNGHKTPNTENKPNELPNVSNKLKEKKSDSHVVEYPNQAIIPETNFVN